MSLTSDDLADIKQLMQALLDAQETRIMTVMNQRLDQVEARFEARFDEQDEKLNTIMDAVGVEFGEYAEQLDDHETRIVRLEKQPA